MPKKQERVEVNIREAMGASQRSLFVAKLEHERGVIGGGFEVDGHHRLFVGSLYRSF
jgi:hypothetical protein